MHYKKHKCKLGLGSGSMLPKKPGTFFNLYRNLRKLAQVTHYHPETYDHIRSHPAVVAERQKQLFEERRRLIHPLSLASLIWKTFMIPINLSHMLIASQRIAYIINPPYVTSLHVMDTILFGLQIICIVDLLINFNLGYKDKCSPNIVMDRRLIAGHYLQCWFLFDFISSIPVAYFFLLSENFEDPRYILIAHVLPLFRAPRLWTVLADIKVFMKLITRSYIWHGAVCYSVLFAVSVHWCSCLVYVPPVFTYYWSGVMPKRYNRFLGTNDRNLLKIDISDRYRKGLFITLSAFFGTGFSMFHATEGDEFIVHSVIILYSAMFMVYTLVFLLKAYMTMFSSTVRYHELVNQVEEYMAYKQFPAALKKRVRTFYDYRYQGQYYKEERALDYLSEELHNEITLHTCHKLLNKVALFEGVPASVVGSVLGCLRPEVYLPNDLVVRAGDIGECMYFIASGTVAVYSLKGVEVCHLEDGAYFGEVALLMKDSKHVATIVAVEITQVYRLDANDFRQFVLPHKILFERIEALASKRMHETVLLDDAFRREREKEQTEYARENKDQSRKSN